MDFQEVLDRQAQLESDYFPQIKKLPVDQQLLHHTRALIHETIEVERELNYKYWKQPVDIDWMQVKEETADQFIFMMNIMNALGLSVNDMLALVSAKQTVNIHRQKVGY